MRAFTILLSLAFNATGTAGCGAQSRESVPQARPEAKTGLEREVKILAEGNYPVDEAFLVVARDPETYSVLRAVLGEMPELNADFFKEGAVIGAFLGQRRTSGYAAEITVAPDGSVNVAESAPEPETPVKMVLSAPFRIVSVPLEQGKPFKLALGRTWRAAGRTYRLGSGEVTISADIAGASRRLPLEGDVRVMRHDRLNTFIFELKGAVAFESVTTGFSHTAGRVHITHLDLGLLAGRQTAPLRAAVEFKDDDRTFSLSSLPTSAEGSPTVEVKLKASATSH